MKNLTPELIAKAKTAKSAEELLELAKANNVELTADEANTYFAQLNANGAVSDDDLDSVAGGSSIFDCGDDDEESVADVVSKPNCTCRKCKKTIRVTVGTSIITCPHCKHTFSLGYVSNNL